ncbi:5-oxoprolinase subunit B family protein [Deinococcus hopiensis]|uniref:Sensor histidine kinase inhibitor, KipI family n=1 Tax=Deinococcus hopiensis KR-140 TaxID=695939 RepID=A0A1W1VP67_9DEIO|nr:allophanate hydrolase subunit 1 [Deinococcus hopiensis]SMB95148.1 sensor histidine kinase inhibitor, KipI family [Deinococcus hopiensis KR-140]
MPDADAPRIQPFGDAALMLESPKARALFADLTRRPIRGVREAVPALNVLTVRYDPLHTDAAALTAALLVRLSGLQGEEDVTPRTHLLPVTFGGPDLAWCAEHVELDVPAFVAALCALRLEVAFLGFTPGFAFLTGLPPELQMPRLASPRERVLAGSVALGGPWAGVYPRETPGGWRLIGRTSTALFDLERSEPVLWRAGDAVRFEVARA